MGEAPSRTVFPLKAAMSGDIRALATPLAVKITGNASPGTVAWSLAHSNYRRTSLVIVLASVMGWQELWLSPTKSMSVPRIRLPSMPRLKVLFL